MTKSLNDFERGALIVAGGGAGEQRPNRLNGLTIPADDAADITLPQLQAENGRSARRNLRDDCLVREFRELADNKFENFAHDLIPCSGPLSAPSSVDLAEPHSDGGHRPPLQSRRIRRLLFIFLNQAADSVRWLGAAREPVLNAIELERAVVALFFRIVSANELEKFPVARTAFIGHDHFIIRAVERPLSAESN